MYAPGVLWTAAHHKIPLLTVMHNNRAYHQEVMHVQRMANRRDRVLNDGPIGTADQRARHRLRQARAIDGHVRDRADRGSERISARRSSAPSQVVKAGEPALVDVVTQPR